MDEGLALDPDDWDPCWTVPALGEQS